MSPDDVRALRARLGCTGKELARALDVDPKTVSAWELGELFPTKRHVEALRELDRRGPGAVPRQPARRPKGEGPWSSLADPELWALVRKLAAHPELRAAVQKLAEPFEDPAKT